MFTCSSKIANMLMISIFILIFMLLCYCSNSNNRRVGTSGFPNWAKHHKTCKELNDLDNDEYVCGDSNEYDSNKNDEKVDPDEKASDDDLKDLFKSNCCKEPDVDPCDASTPLVTGETMGGDCTSSLSPGDTCTQTLDGYTCTASSCDSDGNFTAGVCTDTTIDTCDASTPLVAGETMGGDCTSSLSPGDTCTQTLDGYTCTASSCDSDGNFTAGVCTETCTDSDDCNDNGTASGNRPNCECACNDGWGGDECDGLLIKTIGAPNNGTTTASDKKIYFILKNNALFASEMCNNQETNCDGQTFEAIEHWRKDNDDTWVKIEHEPLKNIIKFPKPVHFRTDPRSRIWQEGDMFKLSS